MKKNFLTLGGSAVAAFLFIFSFSSCHDEAAENVSELAYRHSYENQFIDHYGDVNPNQTWDFSSYAKTYNLNGALTRATMEDTYKSIASSDGYYHIPSEITTYINKNFEEREDNSGKVQSFVLKADKACTFEVAYAYQGRSEPNYDLFCVIWDPSANDGHGEANRKLIFSKGQVEVSNDNSSWKELGTTWSDGDAPSTQDYSYARSKPYRINAPANSFIYFFVKITQESTSRPTQTSHQFGWAGDELASLDDPKTFGLVDIETPANIKAIDPNYEAYLLALDDYCMTCYRAGIIHDNMGLQDFNDVMFLIAGNVPEPSIVYEKEIETTIAKRYMIEDLYAYDYDFNDIVVDASQTTKTPYTYTHPTTNNPTGSFNIDSDNATTTQSATMKHLCGTLPFQITIGDYSFGKVTDPTNHDQTMKQLNGQTTDNTLTPAGSAGGDWNPEFTYNDLTGWIPSDNNITAAIMSEKFSYSQSVLWPGEWTGAWTSEFPKKGDVPYIIAVDTDVDWMGEKVAIPKEWIGGDMTGMDISNN